MINGNETIQKYKNDNKIYVPEAYNKQEYRYTLSNDTLTIITNNNCTTNYNTTQCDCYQYNLKYNVIMGQYTCNRNPNNNNLLSYDNISNDINNSYRITNDYTNNYTILLLMVVCIILFVLTFKKNSRDL